MSNQKNISNDSPCITKVSEGFTPNNPTSQQAIAHFIAHVKQQIQGGQRKRMEATLQTNHLDLLAHILTQEAQN
jgi:hypothetical protein